MSRAASQGDFTKRLSFHRHDEVGHLAAAMDTLFDQLEAAQIAAKTHVAAVEQLRHSDRLATLGRLASSMAHELGNPLNVIELRAQLVSSGDVASLAQAQQNALVIIEQTRRMTRIIHQMLSFARPQPSATVRLDLVSVLRQAIALADHVSKQYRASVTLSVHASEIFIEGDADKLLQMIVNLVINGMQAMPDGGKVTVSSGESRAGAGDVARPYVYVDVLDEGGGIPQASLSRVFEPFFSTKAAQGGTGLGLSVAQGIAHEHAGWITVTSELNRGSTFRVCLPQHGHEQPSENHSACQAAVHR